MRVRAACGGVSGSGGPDDSGAELFGWFSGGPDRAPGQWVNIGQNRVGINREQPYLPTDHSAIIEYASASSPEARSLMAGRETEMTFQCRSAAVRGSGAGLAGVAMDYIDVRVGYRTSEPVEDPDAGSADGSSTPTSDGGYRSGDIPDGGTSPFDAGYGDGDLQDGGS